MRQTVVGVFETSEEARRAQAALLDAQFLPASVRVSGGGTPRGVDEGMAYQAAPGLGTEAFNGRRTGLGSAMEGRAGNALPEEGPLDRLSDFFRELFSPDDERAEMAEYEEAIRRGGALVAVNVEDELEESLASDILIRSGAYDLEERVASWRRPLHVGDEGAGYDDGFGSGSTQRMVMGSVATPGNVASMNPADPTGYAGDRVARSPLDTGSMEVSRRHADRIGVDSLDAPPLGAPSRYSSAGRSEADYLESDRLQASRMAEIPTEADRMEDERDALNRMSPVSGEFQRDEADRIEAMRPQADRGAADRIEAERIEAQRVRERVQQQTQDRMQSLGQIQSQTQRTVAPAASSGVVSSASTSGGSLERASWSDANAADHELVSSREADHLLASGGEVFVDDRDATLRRDNHGLRATQATPGASQSTSGQSTSKLSGAAFTPALKVSTSTTSPTPKTGDTTGSPISRNVRIYSRRADDPVTLRNAATQDDSSFASRAESDALNRGATTPRDDSRMASRMGERSSVVEGMRDESAFITREDNLSSSRSTTDPLAARETAVRQETLSDYASMDERAMDERTARYEAEALEAGDVDAERMNLERLNAERLDSAGMQTSSTAYTETPIDPATDLRAELGLRSPLEDRSSIPRRALDDGAPIAADAYDDDDRRYEGDADFVDSRGRDVMRTRDSSEWDHVKRVVRDAWHRMTGHH
jgi:hypothetical protein